MLYRVIKPHAPDSPDHLVVNRGERLTFERRPTHWEGWLFCTTSDSRTGWIPDSYVDIDGTHCTMRRDYNAIELTVEVGDTLTAEYEESGWVFAHTSDKRTGWVPLENIELIP